MAQGHDPIQAALSSGGDMLGVYLKAKAEKDNKAKLDGFMNNPNFGAVAQTQAPAPGAQGVDTPDLGAQGIDYWKAKLRTGLQQQMPGAAEPQAPGPMGVSPYGMKA